VWGGYTAAAGHQLYTARSFPKKYWNRFAFISEPTAHLVGQGIMESQGAGYVTRDGWNLIAGAEEWFSPVHAQVGPDGAVWVADWYSFINQHNPTPPGHSNGPGNAYETSMRDKSRGRIYRVVYRDAPAAKMPALSKADPAGLVAALKSDNMLWRLHAQRLLVERGKLDVVPQLIALTADRTVDAIGTNGAAFHALWTLHGLGAITDTSSDAGRAAIQALTHPAAGVRKAAAMVLPATPKPPGDHRRAPRFPDPRRHGSAHALAAVLRLAELPPSDAAGKAIYTASLDASNFGDRWLSRALYIAASRHKTSFLTQYRDDPASWPMDALPDHAPARGRQARLAAARPGRARRGLEADGGAGQLGVARPDRVRRRRVVHAPDRLAGGSAAARRRSASAASATSARCGSTAPASPPRPSIPTAGRSPQVFEVPDGVLKPGANTLTVRIQNLRGDGGFLGARTPRRAERRAQACARPARGATASSGRPTRRALQPAGRAGRPRRLGRTPPPADAVLARRRSTAKADVVPAARRAEGSAEVGSAGDDRRRRAARRSRGHQHRRDAAQLRPRRRRLAAGIGAAADALMSSPSGQVQQFVPTCRRSCLDPAARAGPVDHHPVPRPGQAGPTPTSARSRPLAADERGADGDRGRPSEP
jgi:hypothetical protein